jgi:hypothetical protein
MAEPATTLMKSRRRIAAPRLRSTPIPDDYIRDLRAAKWGLGVGLHGGNPELLMSALGQKQTFPHVQRMSAIPPKADIVRHGGNVRFVPIADSCTAAINAELGQVLPDFRQ